tara:strand:- start:419 stop:748 length:330 start_codon:yes stop_codon:yes gene_type:complete
MSSNSIAAQKLIQDLILFYVKENYNQYLKERNIKVIPSKDIDSVVSSIYTEKKDHVRKFLISSMKEIMKDDYIGDIFINNICIDIFRDNELCKNRIILEINEYQKNKGK